MTGETMGPHEDFQSKVIGTLARLETKMDLLVGADGNGGTIADLEERVDTIEGRQIPRWLGTALSSVFGAGAMVAMQKIFGHH